MCAQANNDCRIKYVEKLFGVSGMPLLIPSRELIGEGILLKMCRKKPKHRHFFLFSDILVYGRIVIYKRKLISQHVFELETLSADESPGTQDNPFQFKVMNPKKSFIVCAATSDERTQWILHIRRFSAECSKKTLSRNRPRDLNGADKDMSPIWIPDSNAPKCMNCFITEFSWLQRRHHCRNCGAVVCNKCSQHRIFLPQQASQELRVCVRCFLSHTSSRDSTASTQIDEVGTSDFNKPLVGPGDLSRSVGNFSIDTSGSSSNDSD